MEMPIQRAIDVGQSAQGRLNVRLAAAHEDAWYAGVRPEYVRVIRAGRIFSNPADRRRHLFRPLAGGDRRLITSLSLYPPCRWAICRRTVRYHCFCHRSDLKACGRYAWGLRPLHRICYTEVWKLSLTWRCIEWP
jgi:hypothetical protein